MASHGSLAARAWRSGRVDWRLHLLSVFSLSVAFLCLGSALLLVTNLQAVRERWSRVGRATIYVRDGADPAQVRALQDALIATPGVQAVRFLSPEDARRDVVKEVDDSVLGALPAQAFPTLLDVDFTTDLPDTAVAAITGKVATVPVVETVDTYGRWSERIGSLLRGGMIAGLVLAVVVLSAVVSVVASTMRLALERRRREVEVLTLVGATHRYVRGPFVLEGAVEGGVGATMALGIMALLYGIVRSRWDQDLAALFGVEPTFLSLPFVGAFVVLGVLLGGGSALAGLRQLVDS